MTVQDSGEDAANCGFPPSRLVSFFCVSSFPTGSRKYQIFGKWLLSVPCNLSRPRRHLSLLCFAAAGCCSDCGTLCVHVIFDTMLKIILIMLVGTGEGRAGRDLKPTSKLRVQYSNTFILHNRGGTVVKPFSFNDNRMMVATTTGMTARKTTTAAAAAGVDYFDWR